MKENKVKELLKLLEEEISECQIGAHNDDKVEDAIYTLNELKNLILNIE